MKNVDSTQFSSEVLGSTEPVVVERSDPSVFLFSNGKRVGQSVGLKSKAGVKKWYEDVLRSA